MPISFDKDKKEPDPARILGYSAERMAQTWKVNETTIVLGEVNVRSQFPPGQRTPILKYERWIMPFVLLTLIYWITIYLVDSVIQSSNNWGHGYDTVNDFALSFLPGLGATCRERSV